MKRQPVTGEAIDKMKNEYEKITGKPFNSKDDKLSNDELKTIAKIKEE